MIQELLRPSKSEVTFSQKKKKPTENRLKHVFSRLQKKPALFNDQPVYTALLSCVSKEFSKRISLKPIAVKDGIEYHNTFTGSEAVVKSYKICFILFFLLTCYVGLFIKYFKNSR